MRQETCGTDRATFAHDLYPPGDSTIPGVQLAFETTPLATNTARSPSGR